MTPKENESANPQRTVNDGLGYEYGFTRSLLLVVYRESDTGLLHKYIDNIQESIHALRPEFVCLRLK